MRLQGFLAEGLQRTSAGLGSVIIDSQPLTVAVLAALLFGEKLTAASYAGLGLGVLGLSLLEVPVDILVTLPQKALGMPTALDYPLSPWGLLTGVRVTHSPRRHSYSS